MSEGQEEDVVQGRVKWFDPGKGFGFVVGLEGGTDILLHANVLRNFGQSSIADGAGIEMTVQATPRGVQAVEVLSISPPEGGGSSELEDLLHIDDAVLAGLRLEAARVKWFDKVKGFGFANVFGNDEDVFVHIEVLRLSGLADLQPGEAIALKVIDGKRGRMATTVRSWESASKEDSPA